MKTTGAEKTAKVVLFLARISINKDFLILAVRSRMDNLLKSYFKYVSLNILGMVSIAICIFIDTYFISKALGEEGLTALNLAIPIYSTIAIFTGISQGMQPLVSIYYGQNEKKSLRKIFQYSLLTVTGFAALTYGISFFFSEILTSIFNLEQDLTLATLANEGVKLYFTGFLFVGINVISTTFLSVTEHVRISIKGRGPSRAHHYYFC